MNNINKFKEMIKDSKSEDLTEICEQFLFAHEGAMKLLIEYGYRFGLKIDASVIKDYMTDMHSNGDFDNLVCFGIELSKNQLYKKLHPD